MQQGDLLPPTHAHIRPPHNFTPGVGRHCSTLAPGFATACSTDAAAALALAPSKYTHILCPLSPRLLTILNALRKVKQGCALSWPVKWRTDDGGASAPSIGNGAIVHIILALLQPITLSWLKEPCHGRLGR